MKFNEPCTSLKDRVSDRVCDSCSMGPKHYLVLEKSVNHLRIFRQDFKDIQARFSAFLEKV